ncbi:MAG: hypothetical protein M0D57_16255 [Sphingobacteriales bacterium JAD_PAG50586_3]|nr:MAG: hypothetical protein M0D57_16255 [Sphingobacteriales bacterium JAD_PAG50586_3]
MGEKKAKKQKLNLCKQFSLLFISFGILTRIYDSEKVLATSAIALISTISIAQLAQVSNPLFNTRTETDVYYVDGVKIKKPESNRIANEFIVWLKKAQMLTP